ncbi:hypothetical protein MMC09_006441 [Bachmanniomyces sp. S44760]|nr:hypothetical protein [Bachmanniomyces sp. S44760]
MSTKIKGQKSSDGGIPGRIKNTVSPRDATDIVRLIDSGRQPIPSGPYYSEPAGLDSPQGEFKPEGMYHPLAKITGDDESTPFYRYIAFALNKHGELAKKLKIKSNGPHELVNKIHRFIKAARFVEAAYLEMPSAGVEEELQVEFVEYEQQLTALTFMTYPDQLFGACLAQNAKTLDDIWRWMQYNEQMSYEPGLYIQGLMEDLDKMYINLQTPISHLTDDSVYLVVYLKLEKQKDQIAEKLTRLLADEVGNVQPLRKRPKASIDKFEAAIARSRRRRMRKAPDKMILRSGREVEYRKEISLAKELYWDGE